MSSLLTYIKRRLSFSSPFGFWFTLCCLFSVSCFVLFFALAINKPVAADVRIMNLIASFRAVEDANTFLFITYLGNAEIVGSLALIIACALWLFRRYRHGALIFTGVIVGYGASDVMKLLNHRSRPDVFYALVREDSFSFPSGHATVSVVFYGIIAYFLYKIARHRWQRWLIVLCSLWLVLSIGFSRMYLGVHWFSDVVGGWLLGLSILFFLVAFFNAINALTEYELKNIPLIRRSRAIVAIVVLFLLEGLLIANYFYAHPLQVPAAFASEHLVFISHEADISKVVLGEDFPKYSETITGKKMEPISLIVVGSLENLSKAFALAGWYPSDRRVGTVFRLAITAALNRPDPTAFITPSFLRATPDTIAFEKPTAENSVRQRHHTRFWATNYVYGGVPVWVATASFDVGLKYLITHKIDPRIDGERDFIKDDLEKTNLIKSIKEVQLVEPSSGTNQIGDAFYTGGKAYIIVLK